MMEKADYFENSNLLPKNVKEILNSWDENSSHPDIEIDRIVKELKGIGWDADYDLSQELYKLEPIIKKDRLL